MVENSLDLLRFELILLDLYITFIRSGGSGFGEENPPLDLLALGLGRRNSKPTDGSVGSG